MQPRHCKSVLVYQLHYVCFCYWVLDQAQGTLATAISYTCEITVFAFVFEE